MPYHFLLWNCLIPGKNSCGESGIAVHLQAQKGESVLFFHTDTQEFREYFGVRRACDALVFYKGDSIQVFFVELKGSAIEDAVEQIEQTARAIQTVLKADKKLKFNCRTKAVIVFTGSAPKDTKALQKRLLSSVQAILYVKRAQNLDLREYLK